MDCSSEGWEPEEMMRIALLGEVAAGQPFEVFSVEESLDVPRSLWNGRRVFALRVRGQSMVDAGIRDGDYLIVEPCETADNGRTVVAEVDGRVTVKKLYRTTDGQIRLQPANPEMLPFVVEGERVRVRGAVVGVLRKYGFGALRDGSVAKSEREPARMPVSSMRPRRSAAGDESTLDLALNAIDSRLERWKALIDDPGRLLDAGERGQIVGLCRDLQALRDWCARTTKTGLRRALIADANRLMQRMKRLLTSRGIELPDLTLH
jgi:hypothetical protein